MAKADDDKKKEEKAKLDAKAVASELAEKAGGLVLVRFEKTCAGPKGTYTVGTVAELDAEFVKSLEKDNALSRIK